MIVVGKLNESFLQISCEKHIAYELNEYFSFKVPNAQFHPKFKAKIWDGKIRLFNINTGKMYFGLYPYLKEWAQKHSYEIKTDIVEASGNNVDYEGCYNFMNDLQPLVKGKRIVPRDYQIESFCHCVKSERSLLLSPTSSGKSLVIYSLIRWHQQFLDNDKILIIVPTTNLVTQMYNDFKDYSSRSKWNVEDQCHIIYSGREKESEKQIYISTWQSLFRLGAPYFKKFGMVIGDDGGLGLLSLFSWSFLLSPKFYALLIFRIFFLILNPFTGFLFLTGMALIWTRYRKKDVIALPFFIPLYYLFLGE